MTSWTGGKVQRGPITGSFVIVDDFKEPKDVTVFAMKNGALPKGFVKIGSWQISYQPNDSQSTPFQFTNTTTGLLEQKLIDMQNTYLALLLINLKLLQVSLSGLEEEWTFNSIQPRGRHCASLSDISQTTSDIFMNLGR